MFDTLYNLWVMLFAWMPTELAVGCIVLIGLVVALIIIKIISFIMDLIPFV